MADQPTIEDVYPLTAIQQGLLFEGMAYEGERYVQQICVRFANITDVGRLKQALVSLVVQEPMLRTMFDWEGDEPIQIVLGNVEPAITTQDCSSVASALPGVLHAEILALPKPNVAPPIRFALLQESNQPPALLATYHHVLMDGPGVDILLAKLHDIYQAGSGAVLPNATKNYVGWTLANVGNIELRFWQKHLQDLKKKDGELLAYTPSQSEEIGRAYKKLTPALNRALRATARNLHATPAVLMQAMWTLWAGAYFHKQALHYGLVQSTRVPGVVVDDALGVFINTLPWFEPNTSMTLAQMTTRIQEEMLAMDKAKHYSLSAINQQVSPYASRFDAILTITSSGQAPAYSVLTTRENTGYILALDVALSVFATEITCAVPAELADYGIDASVIAASFSEAMAAYLAKPDHVVKLTQTYEPIDVQVEQVVRLSDEQCAVVADALQAVLAQPIKPKDLDKSFIELGGDSVDALKVSTLLAKAGMRFPVGDLLEADSVIEAASGRRVVAASPNAQSGTVISVGQRVGLAYWQAGAARDYHEQTAFLLDGSLDQKHFRQAAIQLTKGLPSLRTVYQLDSASPLPLVRPTMPTDVQFSDTDTPFDEWVRQTAAHDLSRPFDIEKGPLLRIITAQTKDRQWYLFMSFPSFICDGWSFSLLLERLFTAYDYNIRKQAQVPTVQQLPLQPACKEISLPTSIAKNAQLAAAQQVQATPLSISAKQAEAHLRYARRHNITPSALYMAAYCQAIHGTTKTIGVYDANRTFDDDLTASAISMYGVVLPCDMKSSGNLAADAKQAQASLTKAKKRALQGQDLQKLATPSEYYFVYENYPRDIEVKLKGDAIPHFKERGEWRRQMLPPGTREGLVVEPDVDGGLRILLLSRDAKDTSQGAKTRIKSLQTVLKNIEDKD